MKTPETVELEKAIYGATRKLGVFGCFEVTIGFGGTERVDYLTYDTKGVWRCYEIKISVSDFHSKNANTFVGNFNYYVLTQELFDKVADEIPEGIGVYVGGYLVVKATRRDVAIEERVLFKSIMRSLYREYEKSRDSQDVARMQRMAKGLRNAQSERDRASADRNLIFSFGRQKYGDDFFNEYQEWRKSDAARDV